MENEKPKVGVGVGVLILKDGKVLLGKRKGDLGQETWGLPGGHLEFGEEIEDCAKREVLEEAGIQVKNIRLGPTTNDIFKEVQKHYITLFVLADYASGEVSIMEPDKMSEWGWFKWGEDTLPHPLFLPVQNLLKQGFNPFE